ncbi:MAG: rRNA small subunit methyltransferase 1 [Microthrixaceae bacterium]|nr:rRNA small subunit methyltransferase 1 [Microthrixaceae bacterium]
MGGATAEGSGEVPEGSAADSAGPGDIPPRAPGRMVLVATPLGNLGDISIRAIEVLRTADRLACEDTRRTGRLLQHLGIVAPRLVRMDEHTEPAVAGALVAAATRGETVAVVTDAGMPGLSDPGAVVVDAALRAGVPLEVVPGPFAGATAAVISGLLDGAGRFTFEGFLPRKGRACAERLEAVAASRLPVVLYESPHRMEATAHDLAEACGGARRVSVSRSSPSCTRRPGGGPWVSSASASPKARPVVSTWSCWGPPDPGGADGCRGARSAGGQGRHGSDPT